MKPLPIIFVWDENAKVMRPLPRYLNLAARQFSHNEEYTLVQQEYRSVKAHRFYFASINEGFANLPENIAARFPTPEHLRKWLLIENGYFDEREFEFEGRDAHVMARKLAAFIRTEDNYARITVHKSGPTKSKVIVRRAKSQSESSMQKAEFDESSKAVLDSLSAMIGVKRTELQKEAGRSA